MKFCVSDVTGGYQGPSTILFLSDHSPSLPEYFLPRLNGTKKTSNVVSPVHSEINWYPNYKFELPNSLGYRLFLISIYEDEVRTIKEDRSPSKLPHRQDGREDREE